MHPTDRALWLLAAAALLTLGRAADAQPMPRGLQARPHLSAGFVASPPRLALGAGAAWLRPRGWGLYLDAKTSGASPARRANFVREWSDEYAAYTLGDFAFGREDHWIVLNVAATRPLGPEVAGYLGAGLGRRRAFVEYHDPTGARGDRGFYWVEDRDLSGLYPNVLAGLLLRFGSTPLVFQIGAEAQPRGMTLGAHWLWALSR